MFGEHAIQTVNVERVNSHSRIDFIFISSELSFASQKIKIIHFPFSEHDGVIMTLNQNEVQDYGR